MAQITLTLDLTFETLDALRALVAALPADSSKSDNVVKDKKSQVKISTEHQTTPVLDDASPAPVKKDKPREKSDAAEAAKSPTLTDIRAIALKLSKAGRQSDLKQIFAKYGADKLSGIAENNYPALMTDLTEAIQNV